MYNYIPNETLVEITEQSSLPVKFAKVVGVAITPTPLIGATYILDAGKIISDAYPYQYFTAGKLFLRDLAGKEFCFND